MKNILVCTLSRSLGMICEENIELAKTKLEQLGYNDWAHIAPYMESVMIWDEWDNCKKMRKTVIKRLKRSGAEKSVLNHFTPDNELNELLMRMW